MKNFRSILAGAAVFSLLGLQATAEAGTLYYTSLNSTDSTFAKYDTDANTWTSLTPHLSSSQMAVSGSGDLYNYNHLTNQIELYNPVGDTWSNVMQGPGITPSFGNLEIDNNGRFLFTNRNNSNLTYSDGGGVWNTQALGFSPNAMGDYDPTTGQYVVGISGVKDIVLIDTTTFAQTGFVSAGNAGEHRRSGAILDNVVYEQTSSSPLTLWDLANPAGAPTTLANPGGLNWAGTAADRDNSILYVTSLLTGRLWKLESNVFSELASGPSIQNHSSIAFVGSAVQVSEPGVFVVFGLAIVGLGLLRRRATI